MMNTMIESTPDILERMQEKINYAISRNSHSAEQSVKDLLIRGVNQKDEVVPVKKITFATQVMEDDKPHLTYFIPGQGNRTLHMNAVEQIATKLNVPSGFAKRMAQGEEWMTSAIGRLLNSMIENGEDSNMLVRTVGDQTRAFLSDRYRRMNMVPVFTSFVQQARMVGAIPYAGHCGELKSSLEMIIPKVIEIITPRNGTAHMVFGLHISSSDFGTAALAVKSFSIQAICTNGMIGQNFMRQVHLGRQLQQGDFSFSEATHELDTRTVSSAISDIVGSALSETSINAQVNRMMELSEKVINPEREIKRLPQLGMTKEEAKAVEEIFGRSNPEDGVTGESTMFKLQQAISSHARTLGNDRGREVQEIAGLL